MLALPLSLRAQSQTVSAKFERIPLEKALHEIESQTGLSVMYEESSLNLSSPITASFTSAPVSQVLSSILGKGCTVTFQGNFAVIRSASKRQDSRMEVLPSAKKREIRGTVRDSKSGDPVMFVTVAVKGTQKATMSDTNGRFAIEAANGQVLVFYLMGYKTSELLVDKDTKNPDVILSEDVEELEGTVVTALGLTRAEKSIGYAVTKVESEALTSTITNNWMNGLEGKVAGLTLEQASSGPGGSIRATLRGESSLSHDKNEVLFVIDGMPMISGGVASSSGGGYGETDAPVDFGNAAGDLNPDDIASVTVLKGPAATALYGSQAANGAIVITTKSGKDSDQKVRVDFSTSVVFEQAGFWPDFQEEYGAGNGNATTRINQTYYSFWSVPADMSDTGELVPRQYSRLAFGPRFEGQMFYNYDSAKWVNKDGVWSIDSYERTPWVAQDWYKGAFQTGYTTSNTVALSYNPDKNTSVRFSISDKRNDWILPNNGYNSQNFSLSLNQQAGKRVHMGAKVTYYRKEAANLPTTGYSSTAPMYSLLHNTASTAIASYREEYESGRLDYLLRQKYNQGETGTNMINYLADNFYKIVYEHTNSLSRDRVFGNANVSVDIIPGMNFMIRSGIDFTTDFRTQRKASFSYSYLDGYYKEQSVHQMLSTTDAILTYVKDLGKNWNVNATLGASTQLNTMNNVQLIATRLEEPDVFILQNSKDDLRHNESRPRKQINSVFGAVSLSYRNMVFLDLTGRNDWSSTLARGNWSYFYPSVSTGVLLDKLFKMPSSVDMLKIRGSWANVGNDTDPYNLEFTYQNSSFPSSYILPSTLQNSMLRPENVMSWETGLQGSFFKKRLSFDLAWYYSATTDQIITVPADYITGAQAHYINAGKVSNRGLELQLSAVPVSTKDFQWSLDFNWARNVNRLDELADGVEVWQMNTNTVGSRVFIYAYPGTELGRIYGQGYKLAPEGAYYVASDGRKVSCAGQRVVDSKTGFPQLSGTSTEDLIDYGSIYPDWTGGFSTALRYKNFRMNMAFTYQKGGKAYSITHFALSSQGKLKNSLPGRYEGLLVEGVVDNGDGTYSPNQTIVTDIVDYYTTYKFSRNNVEESVFDTSFLKFKEIRLDYSLSRKWLRSRKVNWLSGASLGVYATNIFCITDFPIYDPEVASLTGASISRGIEACSYPMTRTYGVNLKLAF